ncbi:MAG: thioredoxin family protein [Bacteroidetes bacterium]|nr:thioredoxin family protein [Bacteroidota bacterium]
METIGNSIDSLYNYVDNGDLYEYTFLEFGAKGCSACKRMELVMEDIRTEYPNQINVVFYNILFPANVEMMKYYGISSIPTQILLDRSGKEFFRHSGYYSKSELLSHFISN